MSESIVRISTRSHIKKKDCNTQAHARRQYKRFDEKFKFVIPPQRVKFVLILI